MGRYFKAQPVELNKDFIYQPPLELMMAANNFKNEELQQQGDNIQTLLDSLPFRYKDIDKENYTNIQNELNDKVKSVTEMYNKDMTSPEAKKKLAELRDEVKSRYSSGDIYNIQKTNDNYDAFEKLMEDKKLSEIEKARFRDGYWNKFKQDNPNGSLKSFYTPGNIVEDKDLLPEYAKYHKLNEPEIESSVKQKMGYKWDTLTKDEQKSVVFENGFRDWVDATPYAKDMLKQQKESGLFNDRDINFTDTDQLDMTKGYGKNMYASTKALDYVQHSNSKTNDLNSAYMFEEGYRRQAEAEKAAAVKAIGAVNKDAGDAYETSQSAMNYEHEDFQKFMKNSSLGKVAVTITGKDGKQTTSYRKFNNYNDVVEVLEKQRKKNGSLSVGLEKTLAEIKYKIQNTKNAMKASYMPLTELNYSDAQIINFQKGLNSNFVANWQSQKYNFPPMQLVGKDGKEKVVTTKDEYQYVNPKVFVGQSMNMPNGQVMKVTNVKPVVNSVIPIILNSPVRNGRSINDNDAHVTFEFEGVVGNDTEPVTFRKTAYYYMNEGGGFDINQ